MLKNRRWYFDLSHSLLWVADDVSELAEKVKYFSLRDCVEIPFELDKTGIVLSVDTNIGIKRFMLDTGANVSCLRESLVEKNHAREFEAGQWLFLSRVNIGGVHFGNYSCLR